MLYTIRKIIETGVLDDYMPDRTTYASKWNQIHFWIREGRLQVAKSKGKKWIPPEAIEIFKQSFIIK